MFTGDEEIGSPSSKNIIIAEAVKARLAFNSEPSRPNGNIVTKRKGGIFCHCAIKGVAAHSGGFFTDGRSAIEELAHKIQALHALTDLEKGTTINVGLVQGGQSVNTSLLRQAVTLTSATKKQMSVTTSCQSQNDLRDAGVAGTSSNFVSREFQPLNPSAQSSELFALYQDSAAQDNVIVNGEHSGGCADSGFIAAAGTPVICVLVGWRKLSSTG